MKQSLLLKIDSDKYNWGLEIDFYNFLPKQFSVFDQITIEMHCSYKSWKNRLYCHLYCFWGSIFRE